jgi:hypothetical protein
MEREALGEGKEIEMEKLRQIVEYLEMKKNEVSAMLEVVDMKLMHVSGEVTKLAASEEGKVNLDLKIKRNKLEAEAERVKEVKAEYENQRDSLNSQIEENQNAILHTKQQIQKFNLS